MSFIATFMLGSALAAPPAPTLSAIHVAGPQVDLRAQDVPVLVEVWATWCGPCRETFPVLTRLQREYRGELHVVGLTDEDPMRVRRFVDRNRMQMRYTVVTDPSTDASRALLFGGFGASGLPSAYLLHRGEVLWAGDVSAFPEPLRAP